MTLMQIRAVEYVNNRPVADHHFPIAAAGDNNYRAIGSYNAFDKQQTRICKRDCMERRFWPLREHELCTLERMDDALRKIGQEPVVLPQHHHKDIWAFYEAIGYDYKKKRFTSAKN